MSFRFEQWPRIRIFSGLFVWWRAGALSESRRVKVSRVTPSKWMSEKIKQ
jgi:hypothetical protein